MLEYLVNLLPENWLKIKLRYLYYKIKCLNYNRQHWYASHVNGLRVHKSNNGMCFQFKFANGVMIRSYDDIASEIEIELRGYLANYDLKERDVVVDCGAYYGAITMYAAKLIGNKGIVIAFEPDTLNYQRLLSNIKLNALTNVIAINKGVWSKNAILQFNNENTASSSFLFHDTAESIIDVPVVSIDSELEMIGINKVNFIKMDVEGSELEAIKGAEQTLKNNDVHLAIASYHIINSQPSFTELEKLLTLFNYKAVTAFPEHLTTYAAKIK
jgi:FkbM family methyltransferase